MFRLVSGRRARVERLLFVSMLLAGALAWSRVAAPRSSGLPMSGLGRATEADGDRDAADWRALSHALTELTIPAASRSGSGGRQP